MDGKSFMPFKPAVSFKILQALSHFLLNSIGLEIISTEFTQTLIAIIFSGGLLGKNA